MPNPRLPRRPRPKNTNHKVLSNLGNTPEFNVIHDVNDKMIAEAYRRGLRVRNCRSFKLNSLDFLLN